MVKHFTIGRFDIEITNRSLRPWTHLKLHRGENTRHLVWGKLSVLVEDWTAEVYRVCAECDSPDAGEVSAGDEGWTVCQSCRSIEQGYRYMNKREWEAM